MEKEQAYKYLGKVYSTTKNDSYRDALAVALAALKNDHSAEADKMVPLTLEQLREMGGQPYWHVGLQADSLEPHWKILDPFVARCPEDYGYGKRWIAYAYPTARIDREAWGCELCKDAKFVSGIAYSEKQVDKDRACAVSFSDEGADCDFYYCPNCGKPLTPEAWAELEKRLGGLENG